MLLCQDGKSVEVVAGESGMSGSSPDGHKAISPLASPGTFSPKEFGL
jgi:hypothetical protein